jgi:hypothetical protein
MVASRHESRGVPIVSNRNQAKTNEDYNRDLVFAAVVCYACRLAIVLYMYLRDRRSLNPTVIPDPVSSH